MRVLDRKLLRDLRTQWPTLAGVVAIIAVGVAVFVGLGSAQRILETSRDDYYRGQRMADLWIDLRRAPLTEVERLRERPELLEVRGRVVFDALTQLEDRKRPLTARLISVPGGDAEGTINGLRRVRGSVFLRPGENEVILAETFARANGIAPGDRLVLILDRRRESFLVVGTAMSPEWSYMVRGPGDFLPDPRHFGVVWVEEEQARQMLDFRDSCNQIVARMAPGALATADDVVAELERELEPFGVLSAVPRRLQASHRFLDDEIRGLAVFARVMPALFLVVAALVLNVLISRMVQRQRTVIGALKALGYGDGRLLGHFLGFGVVVGVLGGLAGAAFGDLIARGLVEAYRDFFEFPDFRFSRYPDLAVAGLGISVLFATLGALRGALRVLALSPAEAMRPRPPARGGRILLERCAPLWNRLGFRSRLALRNVFRNWGRSLVAVFASGLAVALVFMSLVAYDSFFHLVEHEFEKVLRSDVDLGLRDETSVAALLEARELPGVGRAEPMLALACDLEAGFRSRRLTVIGLAPDHELTVPRDLSGAPVAIPPDGLLLSRKLAEILDLRAGDPVVLRPVRGRRDPLRTRVAGTVETYVGLGAWADLRELSRIVGESEILTAVQLSVGPGGLDALLDEVAELPVARDLGLRSEARANIETTLVETSSVSIGLLVLFSGVLAFASVLDDALVELEDRARETSTLRVLGWTVEEIAGLFLRRSLILFAAALVLAFPLGWLLVQGVARMNDSDLYRMPVVVDPLVVAVTALVSLVFVLVAQLVVLRRIRGMDWLEGVKVME